MLYGKAPPRQPRAASEPWPVPGPCPCRPPSFRLPAAVAAGASRKRRRCHRAAPQAPSRGRQRPRVGARPPPRHRGPLGRLLGRTLGTPPRVRDRVKLLREMYVLSGGRLRKDFGTGLSLPLTRCHLGASRVKTSPDRGSRNAHAAFCARRRARHGWRAQIHGWRAQIFCLACVNKTFLFRSSLQSLAPHQDWQAACVATAIATATATVTARRQRFGCPRATATAHDFGHGFGHGYGCSYGHSYGCGCGCGHGYAHG